MYTLGYMAESIESLLAGRKRSEPPEIAIVKEFVTNKFQYTPEVGLNERQVIITVKGSALAGALRLELIHLQELLQTSKRLIIRIK